MTAVRSFLQRRRLFAHRFEAESGLSPSGAFAMSDPANSTNAFTPSADIYKGISVLS